MPNNPRHRQLVNAGFSSEGAEYLLGLIDQATNATVTTADAPALTAPADIAAVYTEAEVQALRNDVAALRTTLNSLLAELR